MPRPGPRRQGKTIRLSDNEIIDVDVIGAREEVEWSEAARLMLAYAYPRMPKGWRPKPKEERDDA
jgi:hypothetical protein